MSKAQTLVKNNDKKFKSEFLKVTYWERIMSFDSAVETAKKMRKFKDYFDYDVDNGKKKAEYIKRMKKENPEKLKEQFNKKKIAQESGFKVLEIWSDEVNKKEKIIEFIKENCND